MGKRKGKTVEEILRNLEPQQKEITEKLRSLIKKTIPEAVEMVRRGKITYAVGGKDFAWIFNSKGHVDLDFLCGTRLSSPFLKGRGKAKDIRHIEINTINKMDEAELTGLLKDAARMVC